MNTRKLHMVVYKMFASFKKQQQAGAVLGKMMIMMTMMIKMMKTMMMTMIIITFI